MLKLTGNDLPPKLHTDPFKSDKITRITFSGKPVNIFGQGPGDWTAYVEFTNGNTTGETKV